MDPRRDAKRRDVETPVSLEERVAELERIVERLERERQEVERLWKAALAPRQ